MGFIRTWVVLATVFMAGALLAQQRASVTPFALGVTESIRSQALGEDRVINIYLPEGYSPDSVARYPVIYLLDGSADEDFIHIAGPVQFASFPWVDWLSPGIVVGMANVDRKRDLTKPRLMTIGSRWCRSARRHSSARTSCCRWCHCIRSHAPMPSCTPRCGYPLPHGRWARR
ncbi:MAG: hypothetical protein IPM46_15235 [Flavobacteriales bacterium]|nr:hypothetical protein [Flavobacteriales bacterium]